jgi:hypothetical protein
MAEITLATSIVQLTLLLIVWLFAFCKSSMLGAERGLVQHQVSGAEHLYRALPR